MSTPASPAPGPPQGAPSFDRDQAIASQLDLFGHLDEVAHSRRKAPR